MNFEVWKNGARTITKAQAAELFGMYEKDFSGEVILFPGDLYIEKNDDNYTVDISNHGWAGSFDEVASYLYLEMYVADRMADQVFKEGNGSLDQVVGDIINHHPEIDLKSDDWGGIMGMMFSDVSKEESGWTGSEVYEVARDAIRLYGKKAQPTNGM